MNEIHQFSLATKVCTPSRYVVGKYLKKITLLTRSSGRIMLHNMSE